jgi:hypothetical protein
MCIEGRVEFGEVQFYFQVVDEDNEDVFHTYALVAVYGPRNNVVWEESYHTLWACSPSGVNDLRVVALNSFVSVVSMQPLPQCPGDPENIWFVVEKSGLDDTDTSRID